MRFIIAALVAVATPYAAFAQYGNNPQVQQNSYQIRQMQQDRHYQQNRQFNQQQPINRINTTPSYNKPSSSYQNNYSY